MIVKYKYGEDVMKRSASVLAGTMLLASSVALATVQDNPRAYEVTIDPPVGTMHCGFTLSGNIKTPKADALSYGFFFRSELNIISPLDPRHATQPHFFKGPDVLRVTAASKDLGNDGLFQKHKFIQAQIRVWRLGSLLGNSDPGTPQKPTLMESAWVDVPVTSPQCASMKPMTGLSSSTSGDSAAPSDSVPASAPAPTGIKRQTTQQAPRP